MRRAEKRHAKTWADKKAPITLQTVIIALSITFLPNKKVVVQPAPGLAAACHDKRLIDFSEHSLEDQLIFTLRTILDREKSNVYYKGYKTGCVSKVYYYLLDIVTS
jgi:hypothetical protein